MKRWRAWLARVALLLLLVLSDAAYWCFGHATVVPIATVERGTVPAVVTGPGTVAARVPVALSARLTSTVSQVAADVGDAVRAGQLLVTLDNRDLAARRAQELLDYLEIGHRADALPARMSGGEQQRVAIGRALANAPALILADEPTAALDTERGMKAMALLRKIARERRSAVITVTHDHRMIEGFDTVYHLDDGRLSRVQRAAPAAAGSS